MITSPRHTLHLLLPCLLAVASLHIAAMAEPSRGAVPTASASAVSALDAVPPGQIPLSQLLRADGTLDLTRGFSGSVNFDGYQMSVASDGTPLFLADGNAWHSLGTGNTNGVNNEVWALAVSGSDLYVGGHFRQAGWGSLLPGGQEANRVARWDGSGWHSLGTGEANGVNSIVLALAVSGDDLFVGGWFTEAGGRPANRVARWDGSAWHSLGSGQANGVNNWVEALAVIGGDLYVGGHFTQAGGQGTDRIARWDGRDWHALGAGPVNGVSGIVRALTVRGSDLFVGGSFAEAGGQAARNVARWDGSAWHSLGTGNANGVTNEVWALAVSGDDLFVGGHFTQAGDQPANRVARWDGSAWHSLGTGEANGVNNDVRAMAVSGGDLFVGGFFTEAGSQAANRVARWDGSAWHSLGSGESNGVNEWVYALAVSDGDLFVGGRFWEAGGRAVNRVVRWDGAGAVSTADESAPLGFELRAAFPNPLASQTTLAFTLTHPGSVRIEAFDLLGRRVALVLDEPLEAGSHERAFDASALPGGVYLVRLTAGGRSDTQRVVVAR